MQNINEQQKNNLYSLLERYIQKKHFSFFADNCGFKSKPRLSDTLEDLLCKVSSGDIEYSKFFEWFISFFLDGNNYYFVKGYNNELNIDLIKNIIDTKEVFIQDHIFDIINVDTLDSTKLLDISLDEHKKQVHMFFASPCEISRKIDLAGGIRQEMLDKGIFLSNIVIDLDNNILIVSLNPTTNLKTVDGINKEKSFEAIVNLLVENVRTVIGSFHETRVSWILEVLYELSIEGTGHNNPQINDLLAKHQNLLFRAIDKFYTKRLGMGIADNNLINYAQEQLINTIENTLIDKFGVILPSKCYRVFSQQSDTANSTVDIRSEYSTLDVGRIGQLVKSSSKFGDISALGIRIIEGNSSEGLFVKVSDNNDYFLLSPKGTRFVQKEVYFDVINKIISIKRKVQLAKES